MSCYFTHLPEELIEHVFSYISHKKERRNLALICKKFCKIVRKQSKKHNHLDLLDVRKDYAAMLLFEQKKHFPFQKLTLYGFQVQKFRGLWARHGGQITEITLYCKLSELVAFGDDFKELFPNLKTLMYHKPMQSTSLRNRTFFSESIEDLNLSRADEHFEQLESILELFPGLKRLKLTIVVMKRQLYPRLQEWEDFLDKWLSKLEKIELSIVTYNDTGRLYLLEAFDGLRNEKLSFENFELSLTQENIKVLRRFFRVPRHIKSLKINCEIIFQDSKLYSLIDENAKIDRLVIWGSELINLEGLINAYGVKEIHFIGSVPSFKDICFSPEALSKVVHASMISLGNLQELFQHTLNMDPRLSEPEEFRFTIPKFRNLRSLNLSGYILGNKELASIVRNFPLLEDLYISHLNATNGYLLAELKRLRVLYIRNSLRLSGAFFDFAPGLLSLEVLHVSHTPNLNFAVIESIVVNCPRIQKIVFSTCEKITEECIDLVARNVFYIEKIHLRLPTSISTELWTRLQKKFTIQYPEINF